MPDSRPLRAIIWAAVSTEEQLKGISLDKQEQLGRAFADQQGYDIVRVFRWDGYSRSESDILTALEDFASEGRYEYHELRRMWQEKAFDVFICYTHSRAGRSFTLQSWVIENIIRSGARVYRIMGGWIDANDYAVQIGIGGIVTTGEVDRLKRDRQDAIAASAAKGVPVHSWPPMSHRLLRDAHGKATGAEVREELRPLFDALARLVLEGVGYLQLERELFARFGFAAADGRPWKPGTFRRLLFSPVFWGHNCIKWRRKVASTYTSGLWAFDPTAPAPDGYQLFRDVLPPVYTGRQAELVQAELRRRATLTNGSAARFEDHVLTGLAICDDCHYTLVYTSRARWDKPGSGIRYHSLRCAHARAYLEGSRYERCAWSGQVAERVVLGWLKARVAEWVEAGDVDVGAAPALPPPVPLAQVDADLAALTRQLDALVYELSVADEDLREPIRRQMRSLRDRIAQREQYRDTVAREQRVDSERQALQRAELGAIRAMTLDAYWAQPALAINQSLRRLLGTHRIVVQRGTVAGWEDARNLIRG